MRSFPRLSLVLSVFLLSCTPSQTQHPYRHARHRQVSKVYDMFDANHKRDANVAFTYFNDGLGACGITNGPNDFIVALNAAEFEGGAHCFEMITITINGKTAQAQVTDECVGCSPGGLDFSQGLFEYFAPLSQGEIHGSWSYNTGVATSGSTPTPPATTTPASTPVTTVATTTSISTSTSSSTTILTSSVSTSPTPTTSTGPTSTPQNPQIITQINLALLDLGVLLQASFNPEN